MTREAYRNTSGENKPSLKLGNGSRIGIVGGGPSGTFMAYFLLDLAERVGIDIHVDIYEKQNFMACGPQGCNRCGGIVSESLVQHLSAEGITIPANVIRRGIDSYTLHTDVGGIRIETPLQEKRIAAMYRGAGPLGSSSTEWRSFDNFLLELTIEKGARVVKELVSSISTDDDLPVITTKKGTPASYDLVVGAVGLNPASLKLFGSLDFGYNPPETTKTFICEFLLNEANVQKCFGNSMHVFLLNIPHLEFAAIIPKVNYVTLVLLGTNIDKELVEQFLQNPEVKNCFPDGFIDTQSHQCQCYPKINVGTAAQPFNDRIVLVGDCATTKLYKNGIGAAFLAAKAAATTAVFHGISKDDFQEHYWSVCEKIDYDNSIGKMIFAGTKIIQKTGFTKRAILRMVAREQKWEGKERGMSTVLWDTFTGSSSYRDIILRAMNIPFILTLGWDLFCSILPGKNKKMTSNVNAHPDSLGKIYKPGETIIQQGDTGSNMFVIQSGTVEIIQGKNGSEVCLAELSEGEFFGEMALFERDVRSSTVRAKGEARVITLDKNTLMGRVQEDPTLAFHLMQKMSNRLRELNSQVSRIRSDDRRDWLSRND
ncbi:MAG: cyclic nucleotide-binding domain-containing protein [Calditrichaeota bacterium]|nr:cyclic nucleotide-binding domain-containing protein [Calditrichota bacterium]